jgi:MraZ protein
MKPLRLESFIGKATVAIDSAGRTNFPKDFRKVMPEEAEGQVVVTLSVGRTLALYPLPAWNAYMLELEQKPRTPENAKFKTRITSMAKLSVLDGQNRISLTPEQMSFSGIVNEVTFVGDGNRVRLWSPTLYVEQIEKMQSDEEARFEQWI